MTKGNFDPGNRRRINDIDPSTRIGRGIGSVIHIIMRIVIDVSESTEGGA